LLNSAGMSYKYTDIPPSHLDIADDFDVVLGAFSSTFSFSMLFSLVEEDKRKHLRITNQTESKKQSSRACLNCGLRNE
jgi:hypothetical protein